MARVDLAEPASSLTRLASPKSLPPIRSPGITNTSDLSCSPSRGATSHEFAAPLRCAARPSTTAGDPKANDIGVLPAGADGKPLNLDFETGTLKDWTATGEAFKGQPIKGDTVFPRRGDNHSRHQGQYWIGGFEKLGDKPTGTLTSVPFKVTHRWGSFLVGGGQTLDTCVEIVCGKDVILRATGREMEDMERVVVDLGPYKDKDIFIRIVDKSSGGWGHINFDDFRFHEQKPSFPERPKVEPPPPADVYKFAGLKPEDAAKAMTVPPGFEVSLFAGEPDIHQPIAFCFDHRGRLWVVEAYTYPKRNPPPRAAREGQGTRRQNSDLRGHERNREVRQEDRVHGGAEPRQRNRSRLRGRVDRGRAISRFHPARRENRQGRRAEDSPRWLGLPGHARNAEQLHLGTRRLALRLPRRIHA